MLFYWYRQAIRWSLAALMCCRKHYRSTVCRRLAASIIEHVSKNPVCRAPVVVRVEAELLHARPIVVLGKPHLDIASHLAGAIMSLSANFNLNALKDTYAYSCLLARLDKDLLLMA